jgi:hypothetical protein
MLNMRPAMAAPRKGVNGKGVQALTAARRVRFASSSSPGTSGART